jgi:hypothetical protein
LTKKGLGLLSQESSYVPFRKLSDKDQKIQQQPHHSVYETVKEKPAKTSPLGL